MAPRASVPTLWLLIVIMVLSARALEMIGRDEPDLTCSEGLTDCNVSSDSLFAAAPPDPDDTTNVTHVQPEVFLCCPSVRDCKPCLQIIITVQIAEDDNTKEFSGASGQTDEDVLNTASVKVCHSSPGSHEFCKTLEFTPKYSSSDQASEQHTLKLLLKNNVTFGSLVVVNAFSYLKGIVRIQKITIPSLEQVCSTKLEWAVKDCNAPRIRAEIDFKRNEFLLRLEDNTNGSQDQVMFHMVLNNVSGEDLEWPADKRAVAIPSHFVAPCLCFEVWWKGKELRRELCPFRDKQDALEKMQQNVSLSMVESQMREGGTGQSWNVTAPCRLEGEVWLCKKDPAGDRCKEVKGFRQRLQNHEHAGWRATRKEHWKTGEFNLSSHPLLCIQLKIHGMKSYFEPHCPFTKSRWRWSLPLFVALLLICVTMLGAYFIQGVLRGYMWRWLKEEDVKGAVGGGHVVLLYSPDDNQALPELMSHLGSSLQTLGFSVSLDMWSQTELGALGPVPWLHSRLDRLKRQGGKVVLVLTQTAWIRAEEWGARSWEKKTPVNSEMKEEEERHNTTSSHCVDVFTASLSCILADYLQGHAGERFMLVQFESLPPEPPGGFRPLPELFRGLHLYSLPSQSLGFLTEVAGSRPMATASARRRRAGGLRMASRALAQRLSGFTAGTSMLPLAGVSQGCVGVGIGDSAETVPLKPCLITPPYSPDSSQKGSKTDWV
ncbi:interleukin-17 receptor C isoform X2 [Notolabrus celidotus]|uniref:interleukin-17 receptor C isoform X2 n=1 Tax=Notolabrus celidotus TaxID=1203425 RepID=UPI00148FF692|nr:interleukin-17 receptor C isoform X2 [Notolabrus celidotus]